MFGFVKNTLRYIRTYILKIVQCLLSDKLSLISNRAYLIIAPHPDDEVLGCGGLIARLVSEGNIPKIVIMSKGEASHGGCCNTPEKDIMEARHRLTLESLKILGVPESNIYCLSYPDGGISPDHEETSRLKSLIAHLKPEAVFVPHWGEGWKDHTMTREIAMKLVPKNVSLYEYCVWMWYYNVWKLDWKNAFRLRMSHKEHSLKLKAVDQYVTPQAPCGKPWSGVLPKVFLDANKSKLELYFKIR